MKLTLIQVSSLDGTTNQGIGEDHHAWTSKEDQEIFYKELDSASLVIMGSNTYRAAREFMQHKEGRIRIIMTSHPEIYEAEKIPGKLEFTNENPKDLLARFEEKGITEGLLVGGATTNTAFFKNNLVTDIITTIEPVIVGPGIGTVVEKILTKLKLESMEKLNDRGTLLLKYTVIN
jgi:dihydrofolate reductase